MLVHFSSSSHSCDRNIRPGIEGALAFNATSTGMFISLKTKIPYFTFFLCVVYFVTFLIHSLQMFLPLCFRLNIWNWGRLVSHFFVFVAKDIIFYTEPFRGCFWQFQYPNEFLTEFISWYYLQLLVLVTDGKLLFFTLQNINLITASTTFCIDFLSNNSNCIFIFR